MSDKKESEKKRDRSVAYPGINLEDAVEATRKVREALGKGPYSREQAAKALGHAQMNGTAARKVAALGHYGLLDRNGNTYSQSQLAQDILKPLSEEQKEVSLQHAAIAPRLFQKLHERFSGQALPSMLQNIIIREGVSEGAANEVVRIFTETLTFAKLLENGVVIAASNALGEEGRTEKASTSQGDPFASFFSRSATTSRAAIPISDTSAFVFEFKGGIRLTIPRTEVTSEAIADGELKEVRKELSGFAEKFMKGEEAESTENNL